MSKYLLWLQLVLSFWHVEVLVHSWPPWCHILLQAIQVGQINWVKYLEIPHTDDDYILSVMKLSGCWWYWRYTYDTYVLLRCVCVLWLVIQSLRSFAVHLVVLLVVRPSIRNSFSGVYSGPERTGYPSFHQFGYVGVVCCYIAHPPDQIHNDVEWLINTPASSQSPTKNLSKWNWFVPIYWPWRMNQSQTLTYLLLYISRKAWYNKSILYCSSSADQNLNLYTSSLIYMSKSVVVWLGYCLMALRYWPLCSQLHLLEIFNCIYQYPPSQGTLLTSHHQHVNIFVSFLKMAPCSRVPSGLWTSPK